MRTDVGWCDPPEPPFGPPNNNLLSPVLAKEGLRAFVPGPVCRSMMDATSTLVGIRGRQHLVTLTEPLLRSTLLKQNTADLERLQEIMETGRDRAAKAEIDEWTVPTG